MSLRAHNQVMQLSYDEEKNQLELAHTYPVQGEVRMIAADPVDERRFVTVHEEGKVAVNLVEEEQANSSVVDAPGKVTSLTWQKQLVVTTPHDLHVLDYTESPRIASSVHLEEDITASTSDPHHAQLFAVTQNLDIAIVDIRSKDTRSRIVHAHSDSILELDYNPNKPYSLVSGGKDCTIRLWDVRKAEKCLKCVQEHSHWVWQAKFNSFHDQLVITSGSDNFIILHRLVSVSSTPVDESFYDRESDALLMKVDDFNESVYSVAWSAAEAWFFAAASFDGKVGVFQVPSEEKYRILL